MLYISMYLFSIPYKCSAAEIIYRKLSAITHEKLPVENFFAITMCSL